MLSLSHVRASQQTLPNKPKIVPNGTQCAFKHSICVIREVVPNLLVFRIIHLSYGHRNYKFTSFSVRVGGGFSRDRLGGRASEVFVLVDTGIYQPKIV